VETPQVIPMSLPDIDDGDVEAVCQVLRSRRLALGHWAERFESAVAEYVGVRHAVAVSSGTAALHLMMVALGLGPGDEVLVPSFTFAASVNAILYVGARPVFVDIEPITYNLDVSDLESKVGPRTKAIMVVDAFGHPADWASILDVAERHNLLALDDSCEALGAAYRGRRLGSFGEAAAFAFYPNKQMTTGEGGILVTDRDDLAGSARSLRNQGRDAMGSWLEHQSLGYNYRMDEMSAALGASQFGRIETFLTKRAKVAALYSQSLSAKSWVTPPAVAPDVTMSWFVYVITLGHGVDRDRVMRSLGDQGIPSRGYFSPVHLQPYIRRMLGTGESDLLVTEAVARRTLALPFHNNLTAGEIDIVVGALEAAVLTYS
jgi:perosamine synthetase